MECRPTVKDIYEYINSIAPFENQCEWDNSGFLVGCKDNEVKKIGVVLDITTASVDYAAKNGIDLIVSHHPVIFRAVKHFTDGDLPFALASKGISAICAHTNLDIAKGGVNDALAEILGFENVSLFADSGDLSMIRIAEIDETDGESLAKYVAEKLNAPVRIADSGRKIRKVAFCGGSANEFVPDVAANGCDAYITGELKHHEFLDALEMGVTVITAGHFETENPVVAVLAEKLKNNFDVEVQIIPQNSPVKYF